MAKSGARPNSASSSFPFERLARYSEASSWPGSLRCSLRESWTCPIRNSRNLPIALAGCRCSTEREVLQLCRSALIRWADMVLAPSVAGLFKWRQFEPEMILLAVGWYLRFSLSYRDVEELLAERGLLVDHVTVWRWVQRYAPEIQRRLRPRLRPTNDSWRVDETYIRVKGKWVYLYRAVDSSGATIDFLLSAKRD